jgi:hypothetical protein
MGKSITSSVGVLALIAVLVHTLGTTGTEHQPALGAAQAASSPARSAPGEKAQTLEPHSEGPWTATQQYFHAQPRVRADKYGACIAKPNQPCLRNVTTALYGFPEDFQLRQLHTVLAMVPDPLRSRLALETDRYLDAIQQAAFDSGYELATQWLPWTLKTAEEKAKGKEPVSHGLELEKLPGLLVFRRHFSAELPQDQVQSLLLLFIVGETPTAGIDGDQFEIARQTMLTLDTNHPHELRIAGPIFSGSFLPLTRLLEKPPEPVHIELRAGPATNFEYAKAMLRYLEQQNFVIDPEPGDKSKEPGDKPQRSLTFHGASQPGSVFYQEFLQIVRRLRIPIQQTAQIMEDETGFSFISGAAMSHQPSQPRHDPPIIYRYSRDIAQLRNKYNDSAFSSSPQEQSAAPPVTLSLKDNELGEDAFPTFSPGHTPMSQYAALEQVADHLRSSQVRLVSLSATNIFDTLFLAKILAHDCPDTRIVVPGTDLLFLQEAAAGGLSGVMAISPFPFFPEGTALSQGEMGKDTPPDVTTFTSSSQAAEFNAVLSLLTAFAPPDQLSYRRKYLAKLNDRHPSAWWLVLSSRSWMPVDMLQPPPDDRWQIKLSNNKVADWFDRDGLTTITDDQISGVMTASVGWIALSVLVAGLSLAFSARLVQLLLQPKKRIWSALCLSDISTAGRPAALPLVAQARYFCMIACFGMLAALNGFLLCPTLVLLSSEAATPHGIIWAVWIVGMAFAASSLIAIGLSALVPWPVQVQHGHKAKKVHLSILPVCLRPLPVLVSMGSVYIWWTCCNNGVRGYMLCFRTMTLSSPVCAIWPLMLSTTGLFAFFFFQLRRFTWGQRRQPHLPTSILKRALNAEFCQIKQELERALICIAGLGGRSGVVVILIVIVIFGISLLLFLSDGNMSSFERFRFSWMVELLLALLGLFTVLTLVRFTFAWNLLRAFLVNLNSTALGRYFMPVPEFSGGSGPVWIREVKLMSMATVVNGGIALHNIGLIQHEPHKYKCRYGDALKAFLSPETNATRLQFLEAYGHFLRTAKDIAAELGEDILHPYWRMNEVPLVGGGGDESAVEPAKKPEKTSQVVASTPVEEVEVLAAAAGAGTVQTFYLQSQTARAAFVHETPVLDNHRQEESPSREEYEQASRYVALLFSTYIGYALHQLHNLLICSVVCFVLLVLALNSFSFQSPQAIFHLITVGLVLGGVAVLVVFAQMERDPILSRLAGTKEGELGKMFYLRAFTFGAVPILTVLGTEFPAIAHFFGSWTQLLTQLLH